MYTQEVEEKIQHRKLDVEANESLIRGVMITECANIFLWLANVVHLFNLDQRIVDQCFVLTTIVFLVPCIVCHFIGKEKPWIKYLLLFLVVVGFTIAQMMLTYHMVLISAIPLFFAIQYGNKKVVFYTYGLTVISMLVVVMGGYFVGVCDINMLLLPNSNVATYVTETGRMDFGPVNRDIWLVLPLNFVLPRCILLLLMTILVDRISKRIGRNQMEIQEAIHSGEIDKMTGAFNKNKYEAMVENYYPGIYTVGVIFFDINNLKEMNDRHGHAAGDVLIMKVAKDIMQLATHNCNVFRLGGDEFIVVFEEITEELILHTIKRWYIIQKTYSKESVLKPSVALGYALGRGREIQKVVELADQKMYENKMQCHEENKEK